MHITIKNLSAIEQQIQSKIAHLNLKNYKPKIIAISKTFKMTHINHLINHGHLHFGENKVQEALEKWPEIKSEKKKINLHMVGKYEKKPKIFIQVNIGNEVQKSGISYDDFKEFYDLCKTSDLDVIGTMCIPPDDNKSDIYFAKLKKLNDNNNLKEISMGMSNDYLNAIEHQSTFLRIGSKIFGERD